MIFWLFRHRINRKLIDRLHGEIVAAARQENLFNDYGIADTFEGRFEAVTLHAVLVLRRLNSMPPPAPEIAQELADVVFRHFEFALRETGVGDISVPKKMKGLAEAFLGRGAAYDAALRASEQALTTTLSRNVYADRTNSSRLVRYVEAVDAALAQASLDAFTIGPIPFPDPAKIR
jgi:cytochrome b pre-mRNA-processing protein 3